MPLHSSTVLNDEYRMIKRLGSGGQGEVYLAQDEAQEKFAVKVSKSESSLKHEYKMYKVLGTHKYSRKHFPSVYLFKTMNNYSFLVMTLLEKSLDDLLSDCGGRLSMVCVLKIGLQVIKIVEQMHSKGILHLDLKPGNIMTSTKGSRKNTMHVVDFGMSDGYISKHTGSHVSKGVVTHAYGTTLFMSIGAHRYKVPCRRDDMESLGYTLLFLAKGRLPWSQRRNPFQSIGLKDTENMKSKMCLREMCSGTSGMFSYMKMIANMSFSEKPKYSQLISNMKKSLHQLAGRARPKFDWE